LFSLGAVAQTNSNPPSSGGTPAGSSGQVQYNSGGTTFGADAGLAYTSQGQLAIVNGTANTTPLTISGGSITGSGTVSPGITITNTINNGANVVDGVDIFANTVKTATGAATLLVDLQVGGASQFKLDTVGNLTVAGIITANSGGNSSVNGTFVATAGISSINSGFTANSGSSFAWGGGRGILTSTGAGSVQFGAADAAAPVAQTISIQNVVAGTTNTAGQNITFIGSRSTGSGTSGDIIFQTGGTGAGATAQNAAVSALIIKGATQSVQLPAVTTGTPLASLCIDASNNIIKKTTAGSCV
jgi:hypothetical protein